MKRVELVQFTEISIHPLFNAGFKGFLEKMDILKN